MTAALLCTAKSAQDDAFELIQREVRRKKALAIKLAADAGDAGSIAFRKPGSTAIAGPDMSKPGRYRLTRFDERGPIGHAEFASLWEAILYAIGQGSYRVAR